MAEFGNHNIEASEAGFTNSVGSKFVAGGSGTLTKIWVYVGSFVSTANYRAAIYADSSGSPAALIAQAAASTSVTAGSQWWSSNVSASIVNGTTYWLMVWNDDGGGGAGLGVTYQTPGDVADQSVFVGGQTFPTFPDPYTEDALLDWTLSIYAEYTPPVAAVPELDHTQNHRPFNMTVSRGRM